MSPSRVPEQQRNQPHARYQHIYVVVRVSRSLEPAGPDDHALEPDVTLTKAFLAEDDAAAEADRLNDLNAQSSRYLVRIARLVPRPGSDQS